MYSWNISGRFFRFSDQWESVIMLVVVRQALSQKFCSVCASVQTEHMCTCTSWGRACSSLFALTASLWFPRWRALKRVYTCTSSGDLPTSLWMHYTHSATENVFVMQEIQKPRKISKKRSKTSPGDYSTEITPNLRSNGLQTRFLSKTELNLFMNQKGKPEQKGKKFRPWFSAPPTTQRSITVPWEEPSASTGGMHIQSQWTTRGNWPIQKPRPISY